MLASTSQAHLSRRITQSPRTLPPREGNRVILEILLPSGSILQPVPTGQFVKNTDESIWSENGGTRANYASVKLDDPSQLDGVQSDCIVARKGRYVTVSLSCVRLTPDEIKIREMTAVPI